MAKKKNTRRDFRRRSEFKELKTVFLIITEGEKTERQYFNHLKEFPIIEKTINIQCPKIKQNSPKKLLKKMEQKIKELNDNDQAWIVCDKDEWTEEQLSKLFEWTKTSPKCNLAVSNPKFEYWLLLHFEDGKGITKQNCLEKLRKHITDYDKDIKRELFNKENIKAAAERAKKKDNPPCKKYPKKCGSTFYKLIFELFDLN